MLFPMPVGNPIFSTNTNLNDIFGICYAKIIIPPNGDPILPKRLKTGEIIYPRGEWEGWYFSEELKNAIKFGAKIELIYSYVFDKSTDLFKDFISDVYFEKQECEKSEDLKAKREIWKIILNSSFGRWALKYYKKEVLITT